MKKLYIETYGCQMNVADSEVVASVMKMAGYDVCDNEDEADAIFLNTCSVRENAENKIIIAWTPSMQSRSSVASSFWAYWDVWQNALGTILLRTILLT